MFCEDVPQVLDLLYPQFQWVPLEHPHCYCYQRPPRLLPVQLSIETYNNIKEVSAISHESVQVITSYFNLRLWRLILISAAKM